MKLLKYEGYTITIEPELLTLVPFRKIWKRDRDKYKVKATQEIAYIYFMSDPRSDYQYIVDTKKRSAAIKEGEGLPPKWKPDAVVKEAIVFYNSFKTSAALLLEDTRFAIDKLRDQLRKLDLTLTDDKKRPIYTLSSYTATLKQIPTLIKDLDEAEKSLSKELGAEGKMRGQGDKTIFEDSLNI